MFAEDLPPSPIPQYSPLFCENLKQLYQACRSPDSGENVCYDIPRILHTVCPEEYPGKADQIKSRKPLPYLRYKGFFNVQCPVYYFLIWLIINRTCHIQAM